MKRFTICVALILCVILCMAAASPTTKQMFRSHPSIPFRMLTPEEAKSKSDEFGTDDMLLEAIELNLDRYYGRVRWELMVEVKKDDYIYAIITNGEITVMQELENIPDHSVVSHLDEFAPGTYYMLFYKGVKDEVED